jgi:Zn finger protein HypA/HybF involved in hydrogenase expression
MTVKPKKREAYRMFTMGQIEEASELHAGYCLACGTMRESVEPDARDYKCDECHEHKVYGVGQLLFMGRVQ